VKDLGKGQQVTVSVAEAAQLIKQGLEEKNAGCVIVE